MKTPLAGMRLVTIIGLVIGAIGIGVLWLAGVAFPIYPPPGIIILVTGALLVAFVPWRWIPILGILLGLFVFGGFLISPTGIPNLLGQAGALVALGQGIQVIGVLTALIAGALATWTTYQNRLTTR